MAALQLASRRLPGLIRSCTPGLTASRFGPAASPFIVNKKDVHLSPVRLSAAGASHGPHWLAERAAAAALLGVIPAAFFVQGPAMDALLSTSLVLHAHWGIAGIFADYVHGYPSETGERRYPFLTTFGKLMPYVLSITALACLLHFNYTDVGLCEAIRMLWRV